MEPAACILGSPSSNFQRLVVNHSGCIQTVVHGSQIYESFKRGTGLPLGEYSTVEFILAAPADHGFNIAVSRIECNEPDLRLREFIGIFCPQIRQIPDCVFCLGLHAAVQRGINFQAAFKQSVCAEFIHNQLGNVIEEIRTKVFLFSFTFVFAYFYFFCFSFLCLGLGDVPIFYHLVKDDLPAFFICLWIIHGVVVVRTFWDCG